VRCPSACGGRGSLAVRAAGERSTGRAGTGWALVPPDSLGEVFVFAPNETLVASTEDIDTAEARPVAGIEEGEGRSLVITEFLNALWDIVETGQTPAEELLAHYNGDWNGDVTRVFAEYSY